MGLERNADFRTNIGMTSTGDTQASAEIDLYDASATLLATREVELEALGWVQVNDIFGLEGLDDLDDAYAVVRNTSSEAALLAYASVVDERTGDPTYVTAVEEAVEGAPVWIAAAAHSEGVGGSVWRTDATMVNTSEVDLVATVAFFPADQDNSDPASVEVDVAATTSVRLDDVLASAFAADGSGALRVSVDTASLAVTSRTYNLTDNGTYGQFIPAVPAGRAIDQGETAMVIQLRRNDDFRTNVGVVSLTADAITVEASYHAGDGTVVGTASYELPPLAFHQDNDAIPGTEDLDGGFVELTSSTVGARFLAYASVVDNGSGDPVYIPASVLE
jgi:hypothetical protein